LRIEIHLTTKAMANIVLNMGAANTVIMTLSERVTITSPFFLFHFQSKFNNTEERFFQATNISNNKIRYDEFEITETSSPNYNGGEVDLFTGEWTYDVYQASASTLSISGTTGGIIETDMAIVIDENYD